MKLSPILETTFIAIRFIYNIVKSTFLYPTSTTTISTTTGKIIKHK